eukprot:6174651-Pleurochrysis_carterae.AAC.2
MQLAANSTSSKQRVARAAAFCLRPVGRDQRLLAAEEEEQLADEARVASNHHWRASALRLARRAHQHLKQLAHALQKRRNRWQKRPPLRFVKRMNGAPAEVADRAVGETPPLVVTTPLTQVDRQPDSNHEDAPTAY